MTVPPDEVLSLDIEDSDILYRVCRHNRVIYIQVDTPDLIPKTDRTQSDKILRHLGKLPVWYDDWQTLRVHGSKSALQFDVNPFEPHRIPSSELRADLPRYDLLRDLVMSERISDRLFKSHLGGSTVVVKVATFDHEIHYLQQELRAYEALRKAGFPFMPQLHGYVYEEYEDRVIGIVIENLCGVPAGPKDLDACRDVLQRMHATGLTHGDVNKYNFIKIDKGMMVFDFEAAAPHESQAAQDEELAALERALHDPSDRGRR